MKPGWIFRISIARTFMVKTTLSDTARNRCTNSLSPTIAMLILKDVQMAKRPEQEDEQPETNGRPARRIWTGLRSWLTRLPPLRRPGSGGLARMALINKRSRRKSATSAAMQKPELGQRKRCGR